MAIQATGKRTFRTDWGEKIMKRTQPEPQDGWTGLTIIICLFIAGIAWVNHIEGADVPQKVITAPSVDKIHQIPHPIQVSSREELSRVEVEDYLKQLPLEGWK